MMEAQRELLKYLEANPHLWEYQKELDAAMDKVGDDTYKRLQVYYFFLHQNIVELQTNFKLLTDKLNEDK